MSQAKVKMPVDLNKMVVKSMIVASESGSPPAAAMRWTSRRQSQRILMGSTVDQMVAMLARLLSRSDRVMVL